MESFIENPTFLIYKSFCEQQSMPKNGSFLFFTKPPMVFFQIESLGLTTIAFFKVKKIPSFIFQTTFLCQNGFQYSESTQKYCTFKILGVYLLNSQQTSHKKICILHYSTQTNNLRNMKGFNIRHKGTMKILTAPFKVCSRLCSMEKEWLKRVSLSNISINTIPA